MDELGPKRKDESRPPVGGPPAQPSQESLAVVGGAASYPAGDVEKHRVDQDERLYGRHPVIREFLANGRFYRSLVRRFVGYRSDPEIIEDLMQSAAEKMLGAINRGSAIDTPGAWIRSVLQSAVADWFRKAGRKGGVEIVNPKAIDDQPAVGQFNEKTAYEECFGEGLPSLLKGLDPLEREVLTRQFGLGGQPKESATATAKILDIESLSRVYKIRRIALAKLQSKAQELEKELASLTKEAIGHRQ
jgi:RNA polymerase sigma factor (sigma-70 family)